MSKFTHHPKRAKNCVFCNNWIEDAQMKFKNAVVGYEYEATAKGNVQEKTVPVPAHAIPVKIISQAWMQKNYYKLRCLQGSETNVG